MGRLIAIAVLCSLLIVPVGWAVSRVVVNEIVSLTLTVLLGYVILPGILLAIWPDPWGRPPIRDERDRLVEIVVTEYAVCDAIVINGFEDEGDILLLELRSGQTLCLFGQYLWEFLEAKTLPAQSMRVRRDRQTGEVVDVEPTGLPLARCRTFLFPEEETFAADLIPRDGELYESTLKEFIECLGVEPDFEP